MSKKDSSIAIARPARSISKEVTTRKKTFPFDADARDETRVISDEDIRFEQAIARKAKNPTDFIREAGRIQPPLARGALVNVETMFGFLVAMEELLPHESRSLLLGSAKVSFEPSESPKVFLEGGSHSVWTAMAIEVQAQTTKGFQALLPVRRVKNILRATSSAQRQVVLGVDKNGICVGSHATPFGGKLSDFPTQPIIKDPISRAAMPAFYFREIVERVLPACRSDASDEWGSYGVLLDFDVEDVDGQSIVVCTAVATDGNRVHILHLPRMVIEVKQARLPPAIKISPGFFRCLRYLVNHEWAGVEFGSDQLTAKGKDFIVVAKVTAESRKSPSSLGSWRKADTEYKGCWMVDATLLERTVEGCPGNTLRVVADIMYDQFEISSMVDNGSRYIEKISARCCGGAQRVDVEVRKSYLLDAIRSCSTNLVRLGFERGANKQHSSPIVVRGEDEQFKAIVMPISREEEVDNA